MTRRLRRYFMTSRKRRGEKVNCTGPVNSFQGDPWSREAARVAGETGTRKARESNLPGLIVKIYDALLAADGTTAGGGRARSLSSTFSMEELLIAARHGYGEM